MNNEEFHKKLVAENRPDRCAIIMSSDVTGGYLANAIAVIALTLGQRHPYFVGEPLQDVDGNAHPGLIPIGIPMLHCSQEELRALRSSAIDKGFDVIDFPKQGQMTKDYDEFIAMMKETPEASLEYLGIAVIGKKNAVNRLTKHCAMIV